MARIAGVDIPREKRLEVSLTYIYGIGDTLAKEVCARDRGRPDTRVRDLTDEEVDPAPQRHRRQPAGRG